VSSRAKRTHLPIEKPYAAVPGRGRARRPRLRAFGFGLGLLWATPAAADVHAPSVRASNNLVVVTNEQPEPGELVKRYPLTWAIDGDVRTGWCYEPHPSVKPQTPEIRFELPDGLVADELRLVNGYAKSDRLYRANNRVRGLRLVFSDGHEQRVPLTESREMQRVLFDRQASSQLRVVLETVWPGDTYDDTCLSEIDLLSGGRSLILPRPRIESPGGHYPPQPLVGASGVTLFAPHTEGSSDILFSHAGTQVAFGTSEMGLIVLEPPDRGFGIAVVETRSGRAQGYLPGTIARPIRWTSGDRTLECEVYDIPGERWVAETITLEGAQGLP
jgi:hypothetical protein